METAAQNRNILDSVRDVYIRISRASMRAGRSPEEVKLLAVTKTLPAGLIREALDVGLREFGESRIQEAGEKISAIRLSNPESKTSWHFIGHLQKNKAGAAVELFDVIHSVDSYELAAEINRRAARIGKVQRVLIQLKLAEEETKHGTGKENLFRLLNSISGMENVMPEGLMTIPPFFDDPEMARHYFRQMRELREQAVEKGFHVKELSMGMSNDFEIAIEEGATIVRIGTSIFGERRAAK